MHQTRWLIPLGLALCCLVGSGCSGKRAAKPGVTYDLSVLTRDGDGKVTPQGTPTHVESAVVQNVQEVPHEGRTLSVLVRKTEYEKATFDVTFPDRATQMVKVKKGETRDVLPEGQAVGVRIAVQECH
jgi:hypothetical protein